MQNDKLEKSPRQHERCPLLLCKIGINSVHSEYCDLSYLYYIYCSSLWAYIYGFRFPFGSYLVRSVFIISMNYYFCSCDQSGNSIQRNGHFHCFVAIETFFFHFRKIENIERYLFDMTFFIIFSN